MKAFLQPVTEPLGMVWALLALSLFWLVLRKQWRCSLWLAVPTGLIFLIGSTGLSEALAGAAERSWASTSLQASARRLTEGPAFDAVIVLGGSFNPSEHDLYGFVLSGAGNRVLTGVELVRLNKSRHLVLGGSVPVEVGPSQIPGINSQVLVMDRIAKWIEAWRLVSVPVVNLGACRNTHEEAVAYKRLQTEKRWKQVALITSALHMARSEAAFRKQDIGVTPVACDFQAYGVPRFRFSIFPRQERFRLLSLYMHEKIGIVYYQIRGWI